MATTNTSVTVTSSDSVIIAESCMSCVITNMGANTVWLGVGSLEAEAGSGVPLAPASGGNPGGIFTRDSNKFMLVSAITETGSSDVAIWYE